MNFSEEGDIDFVANLMHSYFYTAFTGLFDQFKGIFKHCSIIQIHMFRIFSNELPAERKSLFLEHYLSGFLPTLPWKLFFSFSRLYIQRKTFAMKNSREYKEWVKRRNRNAYFSYFLLFLDGLETSAVTVIMLFYLEDRFHLNPDQTRMFFSIAEMFNAVGQMTGGLLIGRYTDRTRNLRLVVLINLWATIFGNLIYAMPFSVVCIVIGPFLCGINESLQVAFGGRHSKSMIELDETKIQ